MQNQDNFPEAFPKSAGKLLTFQRQLLIQPVVLTRGMSQSESIQNLAFMDPSTSSDGDMPSPVHVTPVNPEAIINLPAASRKRRPARDPVGIQDLVTQQTEVLTQLVR